MNHATPVRIRDRDEYQAEFHYEDYTVVRAFVRVDPRPSGDSSGPRDQYMLGVVTGYCKTGPEANEGFCPDWVSEGPSSITGR